MTPETLRAQLAVDGLQAWYGDSKALHDVTFDVHAGEVVTLVGRNGAGKTTTLRAIMGIVQKRAGIVRFDGVDLIGKPIHAIARLGIAYCPEERAIFSRLTVRENLLLPPVLKSGGLDEAALLAAFPNLRMRADSIGTKLSGGEQQMLAIARILRTGSRFLMLDEPSEGLAPVIVKEIKDLILGLKGQGYTILLVEQNLNFARAVADRYVVVENGRVVDTLTAREFANGAGRVATYLGV